MSVKNNKNIKKIHAKESFDGRAFLLKFLENEPTADIEVNKSWISKFLGGQSNWISSEKNGVITQSIFYKNGAAEIHVMEIKELSLAGYLTNREIKDIRKILKINAVVEKGGGYIDDPHFPLREHNKLFSLLKDRADKISASVWDEDGVISWVVHIKKGGGSHFSSSRIG
ncbi:hypothetical protein V8J88_15590 [Massilia sp. W12]|uniref:hypothetical protein n=1 Tax=Massilia sp. W12 TaxID=3126507 RepID=UPI0030D4A02F